MEALYLNSRSVSGDQFFKKRILKNYSQHIKTVQSIQNQKLHPIRSNINLEKNLKKFKNTSKSFRKNQQLSQRKKDNVHLVGKLWGTTTVCPTSNPQYQKLQHTINHWVFNKTRSQSIKQENKKLGLSLIAQKQQLIKSKKKIKKQIDDYLQQRQHVRRFKFDTNRKSESNLKTKSKSKPQFITNNFQKLHQIKFLQPVKIKPKRK